MRTPVNYTAEHPSLRGRAWVGLLLLPLLLFAACSSDEVEAPAIANNVTLTLGAAGGRATRATEEDPNALDHELIHSLDVFIGSNNTILYAYHLTADDLGGGAPEGNLPERSFSGLELNAGGSYTVYAFANFDKCADPDNTSQTISTRLKNIVDNKDNYKLSDLADIGELKVSDPAGKIDFNNGGFIPMATDTTLNNVTDGSTYKIYMHRLVSRIDLNVINNRKTEVTLSSFKIGKFCDDVYLLPDRHSPQVYNTNAVNAVNKEVTITPAVTIPAGTTTAQKVASIYVNATETTHGAFSLEATLDGETVTYSGATQRTTLPRNTIFPLTLSFSEYDVNFEIEALIAPIGGYPINVYKGTAVTEDMVIEIPEGCTFTIAPKLQRNNGIITTTDDAATYFWTAPESLPDWFVLTTDIPTSATTASSAKLSGKVSAEAGLEFADDQVFTLLTTGSNGKTYTNRLRFKTYAIDNTTK